MLSLAVTQVTQRVFAKKLREVLRNTSHNTSLNFLAKTRCVTILSDTYFTRVYIYVHQTEAYHKRYVSI